MGTSADEIFDLFMMSVENDTKLNTLYNSSGSAIATIYSEPWLLKSIDKFKPVCKEDLTYTKATSASSVGYFDADLDQESQDILSECMVLYWLKQKVNNALAMGRFSVDKDFRMSAPTLSSMKEYLALKTEDIDQLLSDYGYRNNNWANWRNGIFYS